MRFSSFGSLFGAGLVGLSQASPVGQYVGTSDVESRSLVPAVFSLVKNAVEETLYKGFVLHNGFLDQYIRLTEVYIQCRCASHCRCPKGSRPRPGPCEG